MKEWERGKLQKAADEVDAGVCSAEMRAFQCFPSPADRCVRTACQNAYYTAVAKKLKTIEKALAQVRPPVSAQTAPVSQAPGNSSQHPAVGGHRGPSPPVQRPQHAAMMPSAPVPLQQQLDHARNASQAGALRQPSQELVHQHRGRVSPPVAQKGSQAYADEEKYWQKQEQMKAKYYESLKKVGEGEGLGFRMGMASRVPS